nr:MAG TPA: hypothetical protein [Caudoviricetes sp.]
MIRLLATPLCALKRLVRMKLSSLLSERQKYYPTPLSPYRLRVILPRLV